MAEIRKYNPDGGDGLQKLVRDALGETIRPVEPGRSHGTEDEKSQEEPTPEEPSVSSLPSWPSDGPAFGF